MSCLALFSAPYFIINFTMSYSGIFEKVKKSYVKLIVHLLLLPVVAMFIIFPLNIYQYPLYIDYKILCVFAVPYAFLGCAFLLYSYWVEISKTVREQRLMACLVFIPLTILGITTSYVLPAFNLRSAWKYNRWAVISLFVTYSYVAYRYGIMGFKLKFEKIRLDSTMKATSSGTSIINHAFKNEISKIALCTDNIRKSPDKNSTSADKNLAIIQSSVNYLKDLVTKIQENMRDIQLNTKQENLNSLLDHAIEIIRPSYGSKKLIIRKDCNHDIILVCDAIHIKETFINILRNAAESIIEDGLIAISVTVVKRNVFITINDNGIGMPSDIASKVFDPFFSTKRKDGNFGLGLSYSYNVVKSHGGDIEISSKEGCGTSVTIKVPLAGKDRYRKNMGRVG